MRKLFLLEDDLSLISGLTFAFKKQGFALDTARTLAEAEVLWSDRKYDLLVSALFTFFSVFFAFAESHTEPPFHKD